MGGTLDFYRCIDMVPFKVARIESSLVTKGDLHHQERTNQRPLPALRSLPRCKRVAPDRSLDNRIFAGERTQ